MSHVFLTIIALSLSASFAIAGEFNPVVDIGDTLQPWNELPGIDGKRHSWSDNKDKQVVIVVFTCNGCPYAVDYEPRIKQLAAKWKKDDRVGVIAINSNLIAEDSLEAMAERAKSAKFDFPYLKDEKQELGKAWGATRTPEFFVLDNERKVVYMGAMDNDTDAEKVTINYVNRAVAATLAGETPEVQETVAIGCNIRYKRSRR